MRFGAPVTAYGSPEEWVARLRRLGYNAAYCPVGPEAPESLKDEYVHAARENDIVIAETGAWSNPLSGNREEREAAIRKNIEQLALAERMGALICVNISGSLGAKWDGPHPDQFSEATFDRVVELVRYFIDEVRPARAKYGLETMQWALPDSVESYEALVKAVDRPAFGVHFDPVNLVNSPRKYYGNAEIIHAAFDRLGDRIRSVHGKDVTMDASALVHISEIPAGEGNLDYRALLGRLKERPDVPLMLEHLPSQEAYRKAAAYVRGVAREIGAELPQPEEEAGA